jgi:tricorn protease
VDNGIASAAENGVYGPEGKWLIEGHGVDPDYTVDNLPFETYNGKDAQLEFAVDYLKKQIKANPAEVPQAPTHPDKSFKYR